MNTYYALYLLQLHFRKNNAWVGLQKNFTWKFTDGTLYPTQLGLTQNGHDSCARLDPNKNQPDDKRCNKRFKYLCMVKPLAGNKTTLHLYLGNASVFYTFRRGTQVQIDINHYWDLMVHYERYTSHRLLYLIFIITKQYVYFYVNLRLNRHDLD